MKNESFQTHGKSNRPFRKAPLPFIKKIHGSTFYRYFCRITLDMQVTDELVDKIAHLARLSFDEKEKPEIREDLQKMIGFVEKLAEIDTRDVAPLIHMSREVNVFRDDLLRKGVSTAEALSNAPVRRDDFFTVPKVIKK